MRDGTQIEFGRQGNGFEYLLGGWSHNDSTRTWTIGHESQVLLPRPRRRGTYVLTATGLPFVAAAVPFQRLIVQVNDTEVGRFLLNAPFKIECVLPWSLLADAAEILVRFRHPDAARPCDATSSRDRRWVAISFTDLTLSRAPAARSAELTAHRPPPGDDDDDAVPAALRQRRADQAGPKDVPFRRPGADWLQRPLMAHFADVAARIPGKVAVFDGKRSISFAEAMRFAASLSARIAAATPPGGRVAICLRNGAALPGTILACLAAGRSMALLDPDAPPAALGALEPDLQIIEPGAQPAFAGVPGLVPDAHAGAPGLNIAPMQPTAFLFPSALEPGTWAGASEAAVLHDIGQYIEAGHLNEDDQHLSVAAPSSLDALRPMLAAMLSGGTLHLIDQKSADLTEPLFVLRHAPISVCSGPLAALQALARQPDAYPSFRAMRLVRIDEGWLRWNDVAGLRSLLPDGCHVLYAHSTAETLTCVQQFVTMPTAGSGDFVPAGYALPGFAVSVVDAQGAAVPDGEVGELLVRSPFIADAVRSFQPARHRGGLFAFAQPADAQAAAAAAETDAMRREAVLAAWQAVLGAPPRRNELFASAGGDSLKLIELAVELENRLGRRLAMSLLTLQMNAAGIAAALGATEADADHAPSPLAHTLVQGFESLGGFCEFGFVQRACQVEPYSLLRFAGTEPRALIAAIDSGFAGFGDAETLHLDVKPPGEYVVRENRYGISFHTDVRIKHVTAEDMVRRESKRLGFLAERMRDDMAAARKIYIYRSHGLHEDDSMPALHSALRRHGPNRLVWVMSANRDNPAGSARQIADSLMLGYVDPNAVIDGGQTVLVESWLQVCTAAHRLFTA
jgi:acyl carrier protein